MTPNSSFELRFRRDITNIMNFIVLVLSVVMIVWISIDTFNNVEFMESTDYMNFQFWVCMFFILDFFVGLFFADKKGKYFLSRLLFLLLSIPYLNIIHHTGIVLSPDALYFVRFIPLARGALAMAIVMSYVSSNAVTSLFVSYIVIILMITYFCSLIFFQREYPVNPQVNSYWTSLWWTCMYITTVGCNISPVTAAGKIIAVALPVCGMIMFPLFTVYLTNYVTRNIKNSSKHDN